MLSEENKAELLRLAASILDAIDAGDEPEYAEVSDLAALVEECFS